MKRNIKLLRRLADFIENARYEFEMDNAYPKPKCGTAGCIAGHAATLWPSLREMHNDGENFTWDMDKLNEKLGLTQKEYDKLFYPWKEMQFIDRQCAVRALRRFAKTGKIKFKLSDRATSYEAEQN